MDSMEAARALARELADIKKSARALERTSQFSHSTINVNDEDVAIPEILQTGADAAGAVDDLRGDVEDSYGDVEDLIGDTADQTREELDELSAIAAAPEGLTVTVNQAGWGPTGLVVTTVTIGWDAVVEDIDGTPMIVTGYDIESTVNGEAVLDGQSDTESFTTTLWAPGVTRTVRVRGRVGFTLGEWSTEITVTPAFPATAAVNPATPILTAGMGGITYRWTGLSSAGAAMPLGTNRVLVDTAPAAVGPWTTLGATLSAAGGGNVSGPAGTAIYARFRAFDALGRLMGTSAAASATPAGVALADLGIGVTDKLDEIRYTADGKNRIYVSAAEPARDRGRNYFADPTFANASGYAPWAVVAGGIEKAGTGAQSGAYAPSGEIPALPGEQYQVRATRTDLLGGTGNASIYMQRRTGAGAWVLWMLALAMPTAGTAVGPWMTVPADTTAIRIGFFTEATMPAGTKVRLNGVAVEQARGGDQWWVLDAAGTSIVGVRMWNGTAWVPYLLVADQIVAAESITGPLVKAGTLEVNHVSPSFGADLDISASESVNIIAGQIAGVQDEVAGQQAVIDQQAVDLAAATAAAEAAADGASSAGIAAAAAQAAAQAAQADVDRYATVFAFEADGLGISSPGSPMSLKLTNSNISIRRDGVARTIWDENQMIVPKLKAAQVIVGQTVITEKPTGMTWQRLT